MAGILRRSAMRWLLKLMLLRPLAVSAFVHFGDTVFLQNQCFPSRWLSGGRDAAAVQVKTQNLYEDFEANETYKWQLRSTLDSGIDGAADPSAAQCVSYGSWVYFQMQNLTGRWLCGARGGGNLGVHTYHEDTSKANTKWQVRSNVGHGLNTTGAAQADPLAGDCVNYGDLVYLQVVAVLRDHTGRWLTGDDTNCPSKTCVQTSDYYGEERGLDSAYQWQVRSTPGSGDLGAPDAMRWWNTTEQTTTSTTSSSSTLSVDPIDGKHVGRETNNSAMIGQATSHASLNSVVVVAAFGAQVL